MSHIFSSESVSEGHPDKVCDQISDAILDAVLEQDPNARVACETAVKGYSDTKTAKGAGLVLVFGEIKTFAKVDYEKVARKTLKDIGYGDPKFGFPADDVDVMIRLDTQSSDITMGVERKGGTGAGDQGMMFGAAVRETETLMPFPITLAHRMTKKLADLRKSQTLNYLGPDNKSQLSFIYDEDQKESPIGVSTVVVSTQHAEDVLQDRIKEDVIDHVIKPVLGSWWSDSIEFLVNPTGRFVIGGPVGDGGLTGRKIIVDTYGGWARHGGGAFSGKDPTKVDRSAAYMARYVAKNIVAAKLAYHAEIQLAYAIGRAKPVSLLVNTFGTGEISDIEIKDLVQKCFDFRPDAIIEKLNLKRPIYLQTASYGHFGRDDLDLPWESVDMASELKSN